MEQMLQDQSTNFREISVIIPVYNTEKYLIECMDSVLSQDFADMEILCIDDGSTDSSGAILDDFASKNAKVRVFHISNGGYGHAVNYGIDLARGKYISIVEPDDYLEGEMLKTLYLAAEEYKLEIISSNYKHFMGSGKERIFWIEQVMGEGEFYHKVQNPFFERDLFKGTYLNQAGLFQRDFINKYVIRHHESPGASYQDVGFRLQTLAYCKRFMILKDAFYCHRDDNPNSSIHNRTCLDWIIDEYAFVYRQMENNKDVLECFLPEFTRCKVTDYLGQYDRLVPELRMDFLKIIRKEFMDIEQKGKFITAKLTDRQRKRIQFIIKEPYNYAKREIMLREEMHNLLIKQDAFIIYGIGMFGKKIFDVMDDSDREKLRGFAVSDICSNTKEYEGVRVRKLDAYDKDLAVIVGVTEKYEKEVILLLKDSGMQNILCIEAAKWF